MNLADVLVYIAVSFLSAFIVETMTEYFLGTPIDRFPFLHKLRDHKWALQYVAAGVGVFFAFYWGIDLVSVSATVVADLVNSELAWSVSPVGISVSGLAIGRGSNYLHEFVSRNLKRPDVIPS